MNLQESIRRILREETDIPLKIRRRLSPKLIENAFQTALDGNTMLKTKPGSMLHKASFIKFANFVIDDMVEYMEDQINMDGNSYYYGNDDAYIEEVRNPLLKHYGDRIKKRYDDIGGGEVFESILREESNPIMRRIFRRVDTEKMDKIFGDGLNTMMTRYHQNKHNWTKMNLDKFKSAIVSYVIVDLCIKYSEICFGAEEYYNKVWEFLLNNYSDVMEEKWEEIKPK